jgi:hypothetical protein
LAMSGLHSPSLGPFRRPFRIELTNRLKITEQKG